MVRERVEELEELALGEVSRELRLAQAKMEGLREEIATFREMKAQRPGVLSSGAEIRQLAAELDGLKQREELAVEELERLELRRVEQMQRYRAARAASGAIRELQEQGRLACVAALQMRESKARDELFLGRRTLLQQRLEQEMAAR
jgi:hypothetical protein